MKPNKLIQTITALAVVATLALVTPKAAHAVAAALVQVTNTAANPAVTQSVPTQATQLILLNAGFWDSLLPGQPSNVTTIPPGVLNSPGQFAVPADKYLVITAVDIVPPTGGCTGTSAFNISVGNSSLVWTVSLSTSSHFEYPSGMVFGPGTQPKLVWSPSTTCGFNAPEVNFFGYLTSL